MTAKNAYPRCEATLRNGQQCQSVVFSLKSDDELDRRFCAPHARQAAEAKPAVDAEEDAPEDELIVVADVVVDNSPASNDRVDDALAEAVSPAARGTPREAIRDFTGVLVATQQVWVSCPHCKKRSEVPVPNWSARTKAVELLLEQGFGKPEPAPMDDDQQLVAAIDKVLAGMSDERLNEIAPLDEFQKRFLSRPLTEQMALAEATREEAAAVAYAHGYSLAPLSVAQ